MIGQTIAHYKVTAKLGEGGMGDVYRATDSKLGRDVALKVLPAAFAQDAQRMARFQREAQVLASLNHPNIAAIYGLEQHHSTQALAMELVEGPTLAERIAQGALPLEEALPIAKQIAEALEYAHEKGIIHRDLKPANIKLTKDGKAKVLDFGLAKALADDVIAQDISSSPTLSMAATKLGIILGTAAYMSPEQAKGKSVDRRADIWSFGVVLYEMLAGKQLYSGETASETMAAVIMQEPNLDALPVNIPPRVRHLVRRCLTRDTTERLQAIGEARIALKDSGEGSESLSPAGPLPSAGRVDWKQWALFGAGTLALVILAGWLGWQLKPQQDVTPLRKFEVRLEQVFLHGSASPKISPDGTRILYASENALWVREMASLDPRKLVEARARMLFWSPSGEMAAYVADSKLWKIPAAGGQPQVITGAPVVLGQGSGLAWGIDDEIVLAHGLPATGLLKVSARGGDLSPLLNPKEGEQDFHEPHWLPEQRGLLYVIDRGRRIMDTIAVLANGQSKEVLRIKDDELHFPMYSRTGHIVFQRSKTNPGIWAVPFSLGKLEVTGEPFLVAGNGAMPSVSGDGALAYVRESGLGPRRLVWTDLTGNVTAPASEPIPGLTVPALSPDGGKVLAAVAGNIWVFDLARNTGTRLTFDEPGDNANPSWSPDGRQVIYSGFARDANGTLVFTKPADGSGTARKLVEGNSGVMSPDGNYLVYTIRSPKTSSDIWVLPLRGNGKAFPAVETIGSDVNPQVSPNGRYLLYQTNETGLPEIFIKPFPSGDGKWQVSTRGGILARWSPAGDKVLFIDELDGHFVEVGVSFQPSLTLGTARPLFSTNPSLAARAGFDMARDGKRLLLLQNTDPNAQHVGLTFIQNWIEEFRDKQKK